MDSKEITALVVGIIVVIGIIYCLKKYRWFRYVSLGIIIVIVGLALYQWNENEVAKTRIKPDEIELVDLRITDPFDASSCRLYGRVRNNSPQYEVKTLYLIVKLVDTYDGRTEIIGEDEVFVGQTIPPQQARDFDRYVYFGTLISPKGKWTWQYNISSIKGVVP